MVQYYSHPAGRCSSRCSAQVVLVYCWNGLCDWQLDRGRCDAGVQAGVQAEIDTLVHDIAPVRGLHAVHRPVAGIPSRWGFRLRIGSHVPHRSRQRCQWRHVAAGLRAGSGDFLPQLRGSLRRRLLLAAERLCAGSACGAPSGPIYHGRAAHGRDLSAGGWAGGGGAGKVRAAGGRPGRGVDGREGAVARGRERIPPLATPWRSSRRLPAPDARARGERLSRELLAGGCQ
mmetsp:Transcript_39874/g.95702  ORF Transcript_39874/g.95702 Transcript_39874/m.95702 type:complete len:230 (-) Transcript_39874:8-697(-)